MQPHIIEEHIKNLDRVNYELAQLKDIKEQLENILLEHIGRSNMEYEGTKSHALGKFKLEVKTDYNYKINKDEYEVYQNFLPREFNPVIGEIKYRVDKKIFKSIDVYGSDDQKKIRDKFIILEKSKPSIKVRANV